jgi:hypothetical protein
MSLSILRQNFLENKQQLTQQIFQRPEINSLQDLSACLANFARLQTLFQEATQSQQNIEQRQGLFTRSISKVLKLSAVDTTAFLIGLSTLGLEYFKEESAPWLKQIAIGAIVASQCFSKLSDYFSVKNHHQREKFEIEKTALYDVLKEELFLKLASQTLEIRPSRDNVETLQSLWEEKRAVFISSLQGRDTEMVDIQLTEDETQQLLA